jgi:mono/diheme cytochrome c family protein
VRDLLEGWYGGAGLPSASFDGSYVPASWRADAPGNPADSATIYRNVFARNCRSCHVVQVSGPRGGGQLAFGSYAEFVGAVGLSTQLGSGRMPLARLTMDRFWLPQSTAADGRAAAQVLSDHLRDDGNDATAAFGRPGPAASIAGLASANDTLVRGASYRLDGRSSTLFATGGYAWRLEAPAGSRARLSFTDSATPTLIGVDEKGAYKLSLSVSGDAAVSCAEAMADGSAATTCEIRQRRDTIPIIETIADQDPQVQVPVDAGASTPLAVGLRSDSPGDGARRLRSVTIADNHAGISATPCADALPCVEVPPGAVGRRPSRSRSSSRMRMGTSPRELRPSTSTCRRSHRPTCLREVPVGQRQCAYPAAVIDPNECVGGGFAWPAVFDAGGVEIRRPVRVHPPPGRMTGPSAAPDLTRRKPSDDAARPCSGPSSPTRLADADAAGTVEIRFVGHEDQTDRRGAARRRGGFRPAAAELSPRPPAAVAMAGRNAHRVLGVTRDAYSRTLRCSRQRSATRAVRTAERSGSDGSTKPAGQLNHGAILI